MHVAFEAINGHRPFHTLAVDCTGESICTCRTCVALDLSRHLLPSHRSRVLTVVGKES